MYSRKNTPALVLGIVLSVVMIIAMALPLWTVDQSSYSYYGGYKEKSFSFSAYTIPGSAAQFNSEYEWVCGFVGFLIFVAFVCMALIIVSGALVCSGKRKMKTMGMIGAIIAIFIFFVFMIIGFVGASTYTGYGSSSASAGIGWGEFPFMMVTGLAIPYIIMINSRSYYDSSVRYKKTVSYSAVSNSGYRNLNMSSVSTSSSAEPKPTVAPVSNEPKPGPDGKVFSNLHGAQRILDVYEDRIVLTQLQNFRALMTQDYFKGTKEIPFASMTSVQFKEGSTMILGYIQFEVPGIATGNNFTSENSWTFEYTNNVMAKKVCEYCRKRIMEIKTQATKPQVQVIKQEAPVESKADELRKFKALLDDGIITQEEFDEEKKKILSK